MRCSACRRELEAEARYTRRCDCGGALVIVNPHSRPVADEPELDLGRQRP